MLIDLSHVKLSLRGRPILHDVSLHMREGEIYGLLGPNGAGKSTTLSVVTGLRAAEAGQVRVFGLDPRSQRREAHRKLGVLPEHMGFYDWMSGREYLRWFAGLYGRTPDGDQIARQLSRVGLDPASAQPIGAYSRGMKQRLGLARALLNEPQALILDEPTNGLDPRGRREIHDVLLELSRQRGVGILLCTHLLDDVDRLCSSIGILHQGRTVLESPLAALLASRGAVRRYRLRLAAPPDLASLPQGVKVLGQEGEWWRLDLGPTETPHEVWATLLYSGWRIVEIHGEGGGLEEIYLSLTSSGDTG